MSRRGLVYCTLVLAASALVPAQPAGANPHLAGTFDLSGTPGRITKGPDGNIWVTISGSGMNNTLARIKPNGNVTEYSPANVVNPVGITPGPDGNLWLTRPNGLMKVPPGDPDSAQAFNVTLAAQDIVNGPNKRLWTTNNDELVSFKPNDPTNLDANQIGNMGARGIAVSGGKLWIADFAEGKIISSTPSGSDIDKFDVGGGPQQVAKGPHKSVAYGNPGDNPQTVGRILSGSNKAKETEVPMSDPFGVVFAPDKRWWFAEFAKSQMALLSQNGDVKRFKDLPDNSGPRYVARGANNTLWVALEQANKVARIKGVG